MTWGQQKIIRTLKNLHGRGQDLSYNALARARQRVVSAANYHFGSYRNAVEAAGFDYAAVRRRPRWTKATVVAAIRDARRRRVKLHWSAVSRRRGMMRRVASAALRLFGTWDAALTAAGLEPGTVSRYRRWNARAVVRELKRRVRRGEPLNSVALQREDPALHAAAVRHFDGYEIALRRAGIDPGRVRRRRASETRQSSFAKSN